MKVLLQKVSNASVTVDNKITGRIDQGILVFLGVDKGDTLAQAEFLAKKIANLRIFADENGKMNRSVQDVNGKVLLVSQFTLSGNCQKGNRPSFDSAEDPVLAEKMYLAFIDLIKAYNIPVETGVFGAHMDVELCNDGPVTFLIEK